MYTVYYKIQETHTIKLRFMNNNVTAPF